MTPSAAFAGPVAPRWSHLALDVAFCAVSAAGLSWMGIAWLEAHVTTPAVMVAYLLALGWAFLACLLSGQRDRTIPFLLLIATALSGPFGALAAAFVAVGRMIGRPDWAKLQLWYEEMAGIEITQEAESEVSSRRGVTPGARPLSFAEIFAGADRTVQLLALGVIARKYRRAFLPYVLQALDGADPLVRAQAATIAGRLPSGDRQVIWQQRSEVPGGHGLRH